MASARHLWADCPRFASRRAELAAAWGLDGIWWERQPRVTAKSGWITLGAVLSPAARQRAAIAANAVRVDIVPSCWAVNAAADWLAGGRPPRSTAWPP